MHGVYDPWTLASQHFDVRRVNRNVTIDEVKTAVAMECNGSGALPGYRAMHLKIRQVHCLNVPRDLVYTAMTEICPEGLEARKPILKKKKKKGCFSTSGPNWVFSLQWP